MVTKLEGTINGQKVIFNKADGDDWEAIIPKSLSGTYVVELTAYDDAGNIGKAFKYLVMIDWGKLYIKLIRFPYEARAYLSDFNCKVRKGKYLGISKLSYFDCKVSASKYIAVMEECEGI